MMCTLLPVVNLFKTQVIYQSRVRVVGQFGISLSIVAHSVLSVSYLITYPLIEFFTPDSYFLWGEFSWITWLINGQSEMKQQKIICCYILFVIIFQISTKAGRLILIIEHITYMHIELEDHTKVRFALFAPDLESICVVNLCDIFLFFWCHLFLFGISSFVHCELNLLSLYS